MEITLIDQLPGFRFHPTEEELLEFYLLGYVLGRSTHFEIIGLLNIYLHEPWDLPGLAKVGEREWYFLVPRDGRSGHGGRPNRTTKIGYWKATGSDRSVISSKQPKRILGHRKTLVFYKGRAPKGCRTDWVMSEYKLHNITSSSSTPQTDMVLCKIYRKATPVKVLEQRAAATADASATRDTTLARQNDVRINFNVEDLISREKEEEALQMIEEEYWMTTLNSDSSTKDHDSMSMTEMMTIDLQVPDFSLDWTLHGLSMDPLTNLEA